MFGTKNLAIPDMDVCKSGNRVWAEVKTYFYAPFNRTLKAEVHGMQRRLYDQYVQVEQESGTPVYLFVLEVKTGALLGSFLQDLEAFPCLCLYCDHDLPCRAKLKNGLYFKRSNFEILHTFSETEIRRIALVWEEPVSHRALVLSAP
jgi:hypothetical protein